MSSNLMLAESPVIADRTPTESIPFRLRQESAWQQVETAHNQYHLEAITHLRLPLDPQQQSLLSWLRAVLKRNGPCHVLELGSGRGWAARRVAEDGHQVVASDILTDDQIGLGAAERLRAESGVEYGSVVTQAEQLPFRSEMFDCVFSFATLRHIVDLDRVCREASRVLRPGGLFVAFADPYRGAFTTSLQWFQESRLYRLARGWLVGDLPPTTSPDLLRLRALIGTDIHDVCRRVPFCVQTAREAGLCAAVVPVAALLTLAPDPHAVLFDEPPEEPPWLEALRAAHGLDPAAYHALLEQCRRIMGRTLPSALLARWTLLSNFEGVFLGVKCDKPEPLGSGSLTPDWCRRLDAFLLASAPDGILPVYGMYAREGAGSDVYYWTMPQAGFLVPSSETVAVTISSPSRLHRSELLKIEVRIEDLRPPIHAASVLPGKTVTIRFRVPQRYCRRASLLLHLVVNAAFIPSDFNPSVHDSRLLALQLRSASAGTITPAILSDELVQLANAHAKARGY